MTTFAGRWITSFGIMELHQKNGRLQGSYFFNDVPCAIEGEIQDGKFFFRYQEPVESGEGWFEQTSFGQFHGQYRPTGADQWGTWIGQREWEGIWDTTYGRMRLIQEEGGIHGFYTGAADARVEGHVDGNRFVFRYQEPNVQGEGWFQLSENAATFRGSWRPDGAPSWGEWTGKRVHPRPGLTWLMVFEAYWQNTLAEGEYSYGLMLKEFFARLANVAVRQRFFNDDVSLRRWCREMMYIPEPAIVLISSHGMPEGVSVHGRTIDTRLVCESLKHAHNVKLLHFAACLMMKEEKAGDFARRIDKDVPYPISGYTTSVDWGGSAVSEFSYLDMILSKGLTPEEAARRLPTLIAYAGDETPAESPYPAAGFRFFKAGAVLPATEKQKPKPWSLFA